MCSIYDIQGSDSISRELGIDPHLMRQFRNRLFKKQMTWSQAVEVLPDRTRVAFTSKLRPGKLKLVERHDSSIDGASKLVFRTTAGYLVEIVILRLETGRTSVCISSQVGCVAACGFCATGKMGFARPLRSDEILEQVREANLVLIAEGRSIRNVVFMGMGEPFHNEQHVLAAVNVLSRSQYFDLSQAHLLVSTVGIPDAMVRFARQFPKVGLALSLHSARQAVRERLIPLASRYPVENLRRAIEAVNQVQDRPVMVEYLMLEGLTDTNQDIDALAAFLTGLRVHLNLMPFNEIEDGNTLDGQPLRPTDTRRREEFSQLLKARGFKVTSRYSLGQDIAAACGQLIRDRNERLIAAE